MGSLETWLGRSSGLAESLHELRRRSGLTGVRLASELGWPQSKISKIENGRQLPTEADVRAWACRCGASDTERDTLVTSLAEASATQREHRISLRRGHAVVQRAYDRVAHEASVIRNAEVVHIPGLLQTREYAWHRISESARMHDTDRADIDLAASERMRRQQILYDPMKRFEFVVAESALRLLLCPPGVMLGQLDRLLGLTAGPPNIRFGVIPFGVRLATTPQHCFVMFDDAVFVESYLGENIYHGEQARMYGTIMDRLMAEALTGDQARSLILRAMRDLRSDRTVGSATH